MSKLNSLSSGFYLGFILFVLLDIGSSWPLPSFSAQLSSPIGLLTVSSYLYYPFFGTSYAGFSCLAFLWSMDVPQVSVHGMSLLPPYSYFLVNLLYPLHLITAFVLTISKCGFWQEFFGLTLQLSTWPFKLGVSEESQTPGISDWAHFLLPQSSSPSIFLCHWLILPAVQRLKVVSESGEFLALEVVVGAHYPPGYLDQKLRPQVYKILIWNTTHDMG